jgi:hypothetical protein
LQVKATHADETERVFSTLMGDLVGPRRDFIQQYALNVANLDVRHHRVAAIFFFCVARARRQVNDAIALTFP